MPSASLKYAAGDPDAPVSISWHGTACYTIRTPGRTLVFDPFVTRPGLRTSLFDTLVPDEALIRQTFPRAHDVIIGHSHHDHILDAPCLCQQTRARLIGSPSTRQVGLAGGVPDEQIVVTEGNEDLACGPTITLRGVPSEHGKIWPGRIPLPGTIDSTPPWPPRMWDLKHGIVFNWHVTVRDAEKSLRVMHIDSAQFFVDRLGDLQADVLLLCAVGRNYRPDYVEELVRVLNPSVILPCHWDHFMTPLSDGERRLPGVDLDGFVREIERHGIPAPLLGFGGTYGVAPR